MKAVASSAVIAQRMMKAAIPYAVIRSLRMGDMLLTRASTDIFAKQRLAM